MPTQLAKPRTTCPITGSDIDIVELSNGDFQVRGDGWVSVKRFQTRDAAEWWVSHNGGREPKFPNPFTRVSVGSDPGDLDIEDDDVDVKAYAQAANDAGEILSDG